MLTILLGSCSFHYLHLFWRKTKQKTPLTQQIPLHCSIIFIKHQYYKLDCNYEHNDGGQMSNIFHYINEITWNRVCLIKSAWTWTYVRRWKIVTNFDYNLLFSMENDWWKQCVRLVFFSLHQPFNELIEKFRQFYVQTAWKCRIIGI